MHRLIPILLVVLVHATDVTIACLKRNEDKVRYLAYAPQTSDCPFKGKGSDLDTDAFHLVKQMFSPGRNLGVVTTSRRQDLYTVNHTSIAECHCASMDQQAQSTKCRARFSFLSIRKFRNDFKPDFAHAEVGIQIIFDMQFRQTPAHFNYSNATIVFQLMKNIPNYLTMESISSNDIHDYGLKKLLISFKISCKKE